MENDTSVIVFLNCQEKYHLDYPIKIPFNKSKLIIFLLISLVFLIVGFVLVINEPDFNELIRTKETLLSKSLGSYFFGIITIIFSGLLLIIYTRNLFFKKEAIIVYNDRIINYSTGIIPKLVYFRQVEDIYLREINNQSFLVIVLAKSKMNINENIINFDFNKLKLILEERVKNYKNYD